jgi:hypothetical protein
MNLATDVFLFDFKGDHLTLPVRFLALVITDFRLLTFLTELKDAEWVHFTD